MLVISCLRFLKSVFKLLLLSSFHCVTFTAFPVLVPCGFSSFPRVADAGEGVRLVAAAACCSEGSFVDFISAFLAFSRDGLIWLR